MKAVGLKLLICITIHKLQQGLTEKYSCRSLPWSHNLDLTNSPTNSHQVWGTGTKANTCHHGWGGFASTGRSSNHSDMGLEMMWSCRLNNDSKDELLELIDEGGSQTAVAAAATSLRITGKWWCCDPMPTEEECLCCKEKDLLLPDLPVSNRDASLFDCVSGFPPAHQRSWTGDILSCSQNELEGQNHMGQIGKYLSSMCMEKINMYLQSMHVQAIIYDWAILLPKLRGLEMEWINENLFLSPSQFGRNHFGVKTNIRNYKKYMLIYIRWML